MSHFEREIKVLNINKKEIIKLLEENNAIKIQESIQKIYVYDLPAIYARFNECCIQLKECQKEYEYEIWRNKLQCVLNEVDNLTTNEEQEEIEKQTSSKWLVDLLKETKNENLLELASNNLIVETVQKHGINPNKWIRVRETNGKTTITIKHILAPNIKENNIQNVMETEMEVPSIKEANNILEQLGFAFRNYQEKYRISYNINGVQIDIDSWPLIPTYIEIENDSVEKIKEVLKQLNLDKHEIVSCNTVEVYKKYGIDLYQFRELKFMD